MSSERRVLRPYVGLGKFEQAAAAFYIQIADRTAEPGQKVYVSSSSYRHDPLRIEPIGGSPEDVRRLSSSACRETSLDPGEVDFVVMASSPMLRILDAVHRVPLDDPDAIPERLVLRADTCRALQLPVGGLDIRVCFVLNRQRRPEPLRPWRVGTWLGQSTFKVRTDVGGIGFTPQLLTDAVRRDHGLPDDAVRFVTVDESLLTDGDLTAAITLYVDEVVLSTLNANCNLPSARAFQRQLFMDVVSAIVHVAPTALAGLGVAEVIDTPLGLLLDRAGGVTRSHPEDVKSQLREASFLELTTKPQVFLAKLESATMPRGDLVQSISGATE